MEVMHHPNKPFASQKGAPAHSSQGHQHRGGDSNNEGHQVTPAITDLRHQGGSPSKEGAAGANTQMMKALKLFAKNH